MSTRLSPSLLHDLAAFVASHHRLPRLGDPRSPWAYQGFLLPYVIQLHHQHPHIPDRWGYYLRIRERGLTPDPIPHVSFCSSPNHTTRRTIERWARLVEETNSAGSSFHTLVDWMAWALGVADTLPAVDDALHEQLYRTVNIEPWLLHPYDYLGEFLAEQRSRGWNTTGFFPTPHAVCEMMTQMTVVKAESINCHDPRTRSIMDPCCGSGRMLLHASNYSLNLYGMDIDPLVLTITKINGALYCPWLTFPFPSHIFKTHSSTEYDLRNSRLVPLPPPRYLSSKKEEASHLQLAFRF